MAGDRRVLIVNSVYHMTNDGAVQVLAGQIALLTAVFSFGPFETGLLVGTGLLVNAAFQLLFGVMSDLRDPSRFLPFGIVILGLASILVAGSSTFLMLLLLVALARVGASFYHPVGIAWIGREFRGAELDRSMGFQSGFGDAGEILGMASGAILGVALWWGAPFILWGAINLAAVAAGLVLVRGHPSPPHTQAASSFRDLRGTLRDIRFWILPLATGSISYNVIAYFGPLLLTNKFGLGPDVSGLAIAAWLLVGTVAALSFGRLTRRFRRFPLTVFAFAAVGIACILAAVLNNLVLLLVAVWGLGAAVFLTYPAIFAFASESIHRRLQGAAFGLVFFFQLAGGAVGSLAAGSLAELFVGQSDLAMTAPFWLSGILGLATALYLLAVRRRVEKREPNPGTAD